MRLRGTNGGTADEDAPKVILTWSNAGVIEDNITEYKVMILNGEGNFVVHPDCDVETALADAKNGDDPQCELAMSSFWSGDFQMDQGTYITASVEAKNDKGWSVASRWNTSGAVVQKVPSMMNPPSGLRDESSNSVNLEWNEISEPRDGGSEILTYVLQFSKDDEDSWTTLVGDEDVADNECVNDGTTEPCLFENDKVKYTHADAGNTKLSYKVAAKNKWGTGKFSKPNFEIDVAQEPDQISEVRINDAGMVRITWDDPVNAGGSVIDSYEVQIKNSAGEW